MLTDIETLTAIRRRILQTEPRDNAHRQQLDKAFAGLTRALEALEAIEALES